MILQITKPHILRGLGNLICEALPFGYRGTVGAGEFDQRNRGEFVLDAGASEDLAPVPVNAVVVEVNVFRL
jgi:hypothetical protein